jgi:hypothetical protein
MTTFSIFLNPRRRRQAHPAPPRGVRLLGERTLTCCSGFSDARAIVPGRVPAFGHVRRCEQPHPSASKNAAAWCGQPWQQLAVDGFDLCGDGCGSLDVTASIGSDSAVYRMRNASAARRHDSASPSGPATGHRSRAAARARGHGLSTTCRCRPARIDMCGSHGTGQTVSQYRGYRSRGPWQSVSRSRPCARKVILSPHW